MHQKPTLESPIMDSNLSDFRLHIVKFKVVSSAQPSKHVRFTASLADCMTPEKLQETIHTNIPGCPSKFTMERYSDSLSTYIPLNTEQNHRQLFRAAKAKSKLKLHVSWPMSPSPEPSSPEPEPEPKKELQDEKPKPSENSEAPPPYTAVGKVTVPISNLMTENILNNKRSIVMPSVGPAFQVSCNKCSSHVMEHHWHCSFCELDDYDLCLKCTQDGVRCLDLSHKMFLRSIKDGTLHNSATEVISCADQSPYFTIIPSKVADNEDSNVNDQSSIEPEAKNVPVELEAKDVPVEPEAKDVSVELEAKDVSVEPEAKDVSVEPEAKDVSVEPEAKDVSVEPEAKDVSVEPEAKDVPVETKNMENSVEIKNKEEIQEIALKSTSGTESENTQKPEKVESKIQRSVVQLQKKQVIEPRMCNNCVFERPHQDLVHCTDCPDFDLCTHCFMKNDHGHHPGHCFLPVVPGTDYSVEMRNMLNEGRNIKHSAICDSCDNWIQGPRLKCLDCPDFDLCSECGMSCNVIHAGHRFVKIYESNQLLYCNRVPVKHKGVFCDGNICTKNSQRRYITGDRYKCTVCPDFDLCASCEAFPSSSHPMSHPMIKMKMPVSDHYVPAPESSSKQEDDRILKQALEFSEALITAAEKKVNALTDKSKNLETKVQLAEEKAKAADESCARAKKELRDSLNKTNQIINKKDTYLSCMDMLEKQVDVLKKQREQDAKTLSQQDHIQKLVTQITHERDFLRSTVNRQMMEISSLETFRSKHESELHQIGNIREQKARLAEMERNLNERECRIQQSEADIQKLRAVAIKERHRVQQIAAQTAMDTTVSPAADPTSAVLSAEWIRPKELGPLSLSPSYLFLNNWQFRNNGNVALPAGTQLLFIGGRFMQFFNAGYCPSIQELPHDESPKPLTIQHAVLPNETVTVSAFLRTPSQPGNYISWWRLTTPHGQRIGESVWCEVKVKGPRPSQILRRREQVEEQKAVVQETKFIKKEEEPVKKEEFEEKEDIKAEASKDKPKATTSMVFPTLETESPNASIHNITETTPASASTESDDMSSIDDYIEEHIPRDDWVKDDDGFLTDEEYDILDDSREELLNL